MALLFRLHDYVRNQPGYSDLEIAQTGGKVRTLREVFQSNIATKMEKSLLLTAMVIEAGIHAEPVVVYQKNVIPLLKNNQLKVKIDLKDEVPILLDVNKPFAYNQWFRYAGQLATPVVSGKTNQVIQIYEADNIIKFKGDLRITKTINLGTASLYLQHYPNHLKALFDDSTAKKIIYPIKPNTVERTKSSIVSTSYSITFKDTTNLLSKIQSRYRFQIPEIKSAVSEWKPLLFDERQTIYTLPYPIQEDYELEVELEGWQCVNQEINLKNKTDWGYASLKIRNKGNSVKINRSINIEKKTFNQKEYSELKEMINIYKNYNGKTLILKN